MASFAVSERATVVGKVVTPLTVTNYADQIEAERGHRRAADVRSVTIAEAIVDTGATTLAIPADVIARLGLSLRRETVVRTASGQTTARLYRDAALTLLGREGTFDCLELPIGTPVLLGVVPLEALGLEPDLRHQRIRRLPEDHESTHFTIL